MPTGVVLVVEADADIRDLMRVTLEDVIGVPAIAGRDGPEALERLGALRPALILLSLIPADLKDLEVLRHLRTHPKTRGVPVIATSATDTASKQAIDAGCDDYIEKPFSLDEFIEKVLRHLGRVVAQ